MSEYRSAVTRTHSSDLSRARRARAALVGIAVCGLVLYNTAAARSGGLAELRTPRRYWEDLSVAASRQLAGADAGAPVGTVGSRAGQERIDRYQRFLSSAVEEQGLRPWQFWRTVRMGRFLGLDPLVVRPSDDAGRSLLLRFGFRLLGGVAPYLGLWLGALLAIPALLWLTWELAESGYPTAGIVVPLGLASSPYVIECLSLPYSAVGFYVLTLLVLVPFALSSVAAAAGGPGSLALRTLLAGAFFALGVICRSGTLLLLPGFVLALALACGRRVRAARPDAGLRRRLALTLVASLGLLGVFLAPYLVLRQPSYHEAWLGMWEGLGDFDRSKGHTWLDGEAKRQLREAGREAPASRPIDPKPHEDFFRERFLGSVTGDPLWYGTILAKRIVATVGLTRLSPYGPRDGRSLLPRQSPQEGAMNVYYRLTTPVDFLGFGRWKHELPISLLWAPGLLCLALWAAGRRVEALRAACEHVKGGLAATLCVAAAALVSPVLITTAGGIETQAFALVHLLALGFLLEGLALLLRNHVTLTAARRGSSRLSPS